MKFDVKQENEKIVVFVEIPHEIRHNNAVPRQRFDTKDVLNELAERGIEHGPAVQTATVKNWHEAARRGTWVFEKKIEKPLDKSAEKVILTKEEKPAPKKRKSRAKKKTTK